MVCCYMFQYKHTVNIIQTKNAMKEKNIVLIYIEQNLHVMDLIVAIDLVTTSMLLLLW